MTRARGALGLVLWSLSASAAACTKPNQERDERSTTKTVAKLTASIVPKNPSAPATNAVVKNPPAEENAEAALDPVHRELAHGALTSAAIVGWNRPGVLTATLERRDPKGTATVTLALAVDQHPVAFRGPLAFEKLAREMGTRVVPAVVLRRIGTNELGALFAAQKDLRDYFALHAVVQNDGTIDALLMAPSRGDGAEAWAPLGGRDVTIDGSLEGKTWAQKVASIDPLPEEPPGLLRDYVETLVLDYLSGNVLRRSVHYDEARGALHLTSNEAAFPQKVDPRALDKLLSRLRPVMRFPRGLRDALVRLDRTRARALFADGPFASWLVSPRTLIDLDERRQSLLTLLDARIAEHGPARVLSL